MYRIFRVPIALIWGALLLSCISPPSQRRSSIERVIGDIRSGDIDWIVGVSSRPFLFDGEVLLLERDLRTLWRNLTEIGDVFDEMELLDVGQVTDRTIGYFGDTMEVNAWFTRYAAKRAGYFTVRTKYGTILFLTGKRRGFRPLLYGMTGPLE